MEADSSERSILWDGEVFALQAMAGGTPDHGTISANMVTALNVALRPTRCRVMTSDVKVWIPRKEAFVYPDASVVRERLALFPGTSDVITNPVILVEVLSEGTESFDRGEEFEGYRTIPSLRHFIMVSPRRAHVEHYTRDDHGGWLLREYTKGATFHLNNPEGEIAVDELYRMALEGDA